MRSNIKTATLLLLVIGVMALAVIGCGQGPAGTTTTQSSAAIAVATATVVTAFDPSTAPLDELSTFDSKDPFIQQALPLTTTSTAGTTSSTTVTPGSTTTGTTSPYNPGTTVTTRRPTTTTHSGTISTTTTRTTVQTHRLKVLTIDDVSGASVVTFQVDDNLYEGKKVGDVVNTSWGQIKVLSINAQAQTATFLHGSETRTLGAGQEYIK